MSTRNASHKENWLNLVSSLLSVGLSEDMSIILWFSGALVCQCDVLSCLFPLYIYLWTDRWQVCPFDDIENRYINKHWLSTGEKRLLFLYISICWSCNFLLCWVGQCFEIQKEFPHLFHHILLISCVHQADGSQFGFKAGALSFLSEKTSSW